MVVVDSQLFRSCNASLAAGPSACCATEAMAPCDNWPRRELRKIKIANMLRDIGRNRQLKHLVKVAVVEPPLPIDGKSRAAHNPIDR